MHPNGILHPCTDKSQLAHELIHLLYNDGMDGDRASVSDVPSQAALVTA